MSDIKLFHFSENNAEALSSHTAPLERDIYNLMEKHMECFLGVRFVAHEYTTGKTHRGRIDSLGLDENNCPVILEYKRHSNENVINQGLFYLDWLIDHKAEFELLISRHYGQDTAQNIEWSGTRVLCIAGDFTRYDEHAVAQIDRNIELIRYKYFGNDLLMLEWLNPAQMQGTYVTSGSSEESGTSSSGTEPSAASEQPGISAQLLEMSAAQKALYDELYQFVSSLGDDINIKPLRYYVAFTRLRNFLCLAPMKKGSFKLWLHLDPDTVPLREGFSRNVREIGHWGTGDLEVILHSHDDMEEVKNLIEQAYTAS